MTKHLSEFAKFLKLSSDNLLDSSEQNADLKDIFIKHWATSIKKDGKIYVENGKLVIQEWLRDDGAEFFETVVMLVKEKLKNHQYQNAFGANIEIRYLNQLIYSDTNPMLKQDFLLHDAGQIAGMSGINRLIDLGRDDDVARCIISTAKSYGNFLVLNLLFSDIAYASTINIASGMYTNSWTERYKDEGVMGRVVELMMNQNEL